MSKIITYFRTFKKLGYGSLFLVFIHRLKVKTGYYKLILPINYCPIPEDFTINKHYKFIKLPNKWGLDSTSKCIEIAEKLISGEALLFSKEKYLFESIPNWFKDQKKITSYDLNKKHWTSFKHFAGNDLKRTWELSRFAWAPLLARATLLSGDTKYLTYINKWIKNWCIKNPINAGPNWICAQEASIRLIHIMQTWKLLDNNEPYPLHLDGRINFTFEHLKRIYKTVNYAKSQKNNHWISESASLFIGGNWLAKANNKYNNFAKKCAEKGLINLEESINSLIMEDGSFSQHSTNYHRFVLDTICQVKIWIKLLNLKPLSKNSNRKFLLATNWLDKFLDDISGSVPNLGNNDGTFCYQLHNLDYRDFRPTLKLSQLLSNSNTSSLLDAGPWDEPLVWLNFKQVLSQKKGVKHSEVFKNGGYAIIRPNKSRWAMLRLPIYKFRPAHSDPLHFDLWSQGVNILRDGGTFSYNTKEQYINYFKGIESHNCVQLDGENPMYPLGRFLWGNWLNMESFKDFFYEKDNLKLSSSYTCKNGRHNRKVEVSNHGKNWKIIDEISSFKTEAIIRWRLAPIKWNLKDFRLNSSLAAIEIMPKQEIESIKLTTGYESIYYGEIKEIPVLKILLKQSPVKVTFLINLKS